MKKYVHLSLVEREILFGFKKEGLSFRAIAIRLGRSHSTVTREWKRYTRYGREYLPIKSHTKAKMLESAQRTKAPLKSKEVYLYVRDKLRHGWSPETIAGRLSLDHSGTSIGIETIYRYIYNSRKTRGEHLWRYLTQHRRKRLTLHSRKVKGHKWNNVLKIDERSTEINQRCSYGHWETDDMEGIRSDSARVSVSVERKSRFVLYDKLGNHKPITKSQSLTDTLHKLPRHMVLSLTCDRGIENQYHQNTSASLGSIPVYFCNPYHSWEKGSVENSIKRLRRFLPKHTSLKDLSPTYLKQLETYANHTPRKCLGYKTPFEVLQSHINHSGALHVRM